MAIIGKPSHAQKEAYGKVVALQREIIARARPGVRAGDLHRDAMTVAKELGIALSMVLVGHGLGLRLHEHPILSHFEEQLLEKDMLMAIEIGHAFPGLGHFLVEDLVRITERGGERITTLIDTNEMLVVG